MKGVGPLQDLSPLKRLLARIAFLIMYSMGYAAVFATIVVGLAKDGSGKHSYVSNVWGQIFAIELVHGLVWMFGHMSIAIGINPDLVCRLLLEKKKKKI